MGVSIDVECDECGRTIFDGYGKRSGDTLCRDCYEKLEEQVQELEEKLDSLSQRYVDIDHAERFSPTLFDTLIKQVESQLFTEEELNIIYQEVK